MTTQTTQHDAQQSINHRLEQIDEALSLTGYSQPTFSVEIESSLRYVRIWDGAYTSYAEWATFDRQLDKVVSDAQKAQAEGRSDEAARDHYSLVFCQIVDAELDSDTDAEVLAAWAVEDDDAEDYSILRPLSLILRPPIRYSVTYKLD